MRSIGAIDENGFSTIRMCFGEIFNNINDHSKLDIGCVFAQHFPKMNKITISISDFGVGIPSKIKKLSEYSSLNDSEALEKALEEGVTTMSVPNNRGAGLGIFIQNAVVNMSGEVYIYSKQWCFIL